MKQFPKQNHRCRKQTYSYQREMMVERDNLGGWNQHRHPYIQKAGNQEGPTVYSTGNSTPYIVMTYMEKNPLKYIYVYIYQCRPKTNTTI